MVAAKERERPSPYKRIRGGLNGLLLTDLRTMFLRSLPILLMACAASPGTEQGGDRIPYDLGNPAFIITLPNTLIEISALTDVDSTSVGCVQDEAGTIYVISLIDGKVMGEFPFAGPGDMEGLTRVGGKFFALRSDGLIYDLEISGVLKSAVVQDSFRLDLPNNNIEGLGYDDRNDRVLVSPKDLMKGSKEGKDERVLYAFDPKDASHKTAVVLRLSITELMVQARAMGIPVPERKTENGRVLPALKLRYSSVAVHPVTDHYYLLSAVDRTLLVVDRQGKLIALEQLDAALLPKPEGITFMPNGDLVLSSEGKGRASVIVRYAYRKG